MTYQGNRPPEGQDGWIAVNRSMRDHWLVGFGQFVRPCDPSLGFCFSRAEAWQDLIMECQWDPDGRTVNNKGKKMRLERGQLLGAVSWLANRWNWTPKTVRGFLDRLEEERMMEREKGQSKGQSRRRYANILTVCNYEKYQSPNGWAGQINGHIEGQLNGQSRANKGPIKGHIYKDNNLTTEQTLEPNGSCADRSAPLPLQLSPEPKSKTKKRRKPAIDGAAIVAAFDAYNDMALECGVRQAMSLSPGRRSSIGARLKEYGPDGWEKALGMVRQSKWLRGLIDGRNGPFGMHLDWLMKRANFDKVIDGNYGNGAHAGETDEEKLRKEAEFDAVWARAREATAEFEK